MEPELEKELKKLKKLERSQKLILNYITKIGKWFLYSIPILLIKITILAILAIIDLLDTSLVGVIIKIYFYFSLSFYSFNSIMLFLGANKTNKLLNSRIDFERKKGRPIDSLDGFNLLSNNVKSVINVLRLTALVCLFAVVLYISMVVLNIIGLGIIGLGYIAYAAIGLTLFSLGLVLLIRSLNLKISDVNGLQDFYIPNNHQIFLDNLFSDVISNHLDPITFLKWDEYKKGITEILNPSFIQKIKKLEKSEKPITFALEKILYLYYLRFQDVLTEERFTKEISEVVKLDSKTFDVEKGLIIEGKWHFSKKDFFKLFDYIKFYNPGFYNIVDRLQLELKDNIERLAQDKIYIDSAAQEIVYKNQTLNIMTYLYNNSPNAKEYRLKIIAPGFEPKKITLDIKVEGRGSFKIPEEPIPLTSSKSTDIVGVLSDMLENGDTSWLTLEPRATGEQTIQIFLETAKGTIIEGKTKTVKISKNMKTQLKKFTSLGSLLGGIATPISRMLFII